MEKKISRPTKKILLRSLLLFSFPQLSTPASEVTTNLMKQSLNGDFAEFINVNADKRFCIRFLLSSLREQIPLLNPATAHIKGWIHYG